MKKYTLTMNQVSGEIGFTYNAESILVEYKCTANISETQQIWLFENMPFHEHKIQAIKKQISTASKLICEDVNISFDMFYERYGLKVGKKEAQNAWKRMSKAKQIQAYYYIETYLSRLKMGVGQRYPATYLNSEPWND
jgi:hypothetical protein